MSTLAKVSANRNSLKYLFTGFKNTWGALSIYTHIYSIFMLFTAMQCWIRILMMRLQYSSNMHGVYIVKDSKNPPR